MKRIFSLVTAVLLTSCTALESESVATNSPQIEEINNEVTPVAQAAVQPVNENQAWLDAGFTEDPPHIMSYLIWKPLADTPEEALAWTKVLGYRGEARAYDIQLLDHWRYTGQVQSPQEALEWIALGLNWNDVKNLKDVSLNTPEQARPWIENFGEPYYFLDYIRNGVTSVDDALSLRDSGISYLHVRLWLRVTGSVDQALRWAEVVSSSDSVVEWNRHGIDTPEEAAAWLSHDFGWWDAREWKIAGVASPSEARKWAQLGVEDEIFSGLKSSGIETQSQLSQVCGKLVTSEDFVRSNPFSLTGQCVAACPRVQMVRSQTIAFADLNSRSLVITAPTELSMDFAERQRACGVFKIEGTETFTLVDGSTVTGNLLRRLSRH